MKRVLPSPSLGPVIALVSGTGPASDVSVAAGGSATVNIEVSSPVINRECAVALAAIKGISGSLVIQGIDVSVEDGKVTVSIDVKNTDTANAATVSAGSVTVRLLVAG